MILGGAAVGCVVVYKGWESRYHKSALVRLHACAIDAIIRVILLFPCVPVLVRPSRNVLSVVCC